MDRLVEAALRYRVLVLLATVFVIVLGVVSLRNLPMDAEPDITPNQVLVLTRAPSLSPLEVEQLISFPVELAMSGLPGVTHIQSTSKYGLSYVAIYFKDGMDTYFCRNLVNERLPQAKEAIPATVGVPEMGPISTGLGEIYQFNVTGSGRSPMELRTILDWDIAPKLRQVSGIVEVNSQGGELKTYQVAVDNDKLTGYHIPLRRVIEALSKNNANSGGAYIEHSEQQSLIRGEGLIGSLSDIENIVVGNSPTGTPIFIRNIGNVQYAPMVRNGFATEDGKGEIVLGVSMMLVGDNSRAVAIRVKDSLAEIQKTLPPGVRIVPLYDRTDLVNRTIHTVTRNLIEGGLLVIAVLLLLLGSFRAGIIVSLAIPLSMLAAFIGMVQANISGNLMSLGALDFGLIVDGSVVIIENILRRLHHRKPDEDLESVFGSAAREVAKPIFFGVLIIVLVYVPILTLSGVEGKMFKPMAVTVLFALLASLVIALTVMPVLGWYALPKHPKKEHTWLMRKADHFYRPALKRALRSPFWTGGIALGIFLASLFAIPFLGAVFIPSLDEGSILVQMYRVPGISITESLHGNQIVETVLREFPEVSHVFSRTGSPEVATDPMAIDQSDVYVMLKPTEQWPVKRSKNDLIAAMKKRLGEEAPGAVYSFSQPIQMRMQELMEGGSRSDIAIKLFGDNLDTLRQKADQIAAVVQKIPGAADVRAERVAGLPYLRLRLRRDALARHGLDASDVLDTIQAIGGKTVGEIVEGNRRFALQVRFPEQQRATDEAIGNLRVGDNEGHFIPLAQLADIQEEDGPAQISREGGQRRISVEVNVRGRDLASFVSAAKQAIATQIKIPSGYQLEWSGQFEQLKSASQRLMIVVPAALTLIFVLLYFNFQATFPALLIFLNIPLAATGGILALLVRGLPFSISAGVGFIALFGIAVLNGIVLLTYIRELRQKGCPIEEAVEQGALTRLRPVLMTALVASLGFIPMAVSHGAGAEVQRPLATVVIGGLVTSTLLTLLVLPTLYKWVEQRREAKGVQA
ncbi:MAG: cation transporter [Acidobacteriales bacterium 59-55]|jgi:cobalt-zinc-cadmium resistance protein CzcA|uniref:Cobalt-zinc-cadmium resistance protein CzcA n=1 Tax=Acidipila rosea TaxID=768535 RepID=A0A4R1L6Z6_9BACT|nr:CusA/CzcA family heavy metal efflux RND transporter [Acidipila rosea]MBN9615131.1 efflux RND transporter permease subunit [Terriglobales bacterium]OJV40321.1 MAG: cation transporter [Acidobacteriales bacterium 59-55]TCK72860.1 cobalt-zinc-cadmium resistance protein CzcA [Acidipila rosea]HZY62815.1 CusA/CzcA family heavy metal efflux RND transporter [Edaphobacter sp.]